ncbi:MAG: DUF192 domain-containing protein [Deltaproteobacteria bacterium]|nr:DUF192 domain-containing protein [Deltaproteobacteria bacterium]
MPLECKLPRLPQKGLRIERVRLHTQPSQEIDVELAIGGQRQIGMMCRTHMPDDTGMLFLFSREKRQSFWMKNTLLPLDMVFIDRDGIIVGIVANTRPLDLRSRGVSIPSQFVLELLGGDAKKRGLSVGHRIEFLFDLAAIDL